MARSYANIFTAIWEDEEFTALSSDAQRAYFMLVTQPDITACGSLALTLKRWASLVRAGDRDKLQPALVELDAAEFVKIDDDTEELLVRTFVKHDGGHKHATRLKAVLSYAQALRSKRLRSSLALEFHKLGVDTASLVGPEWDSSGTQVAPESYRSVVVTKDEVATALRTPESTLQGRGPMPTPPDGDAPASPFCAKHPNGTSENCRDCATARRRFDAWHRERPSREAARRADAERRRAELANCPDCGGGHWREDGTKCDHSRRSA
jgi:hypothetical protein